MKAVFFFWSRAIMTTKKEAQLSKGVRKEGTIVRNGNCTVPDPWKACRKGANMQGTSVAWSKRVISMNNNAIFVA
jgi:hypothetical protein